MSIDVVKPLGLECPQEGGTEYVPYPTEFDVTEDHVAVKGVAFEGNTTAVAWADAGIMKFKDTEHKKSAFLMDLAQNFSFKILDTEDYVRIKDNQQMFLMSDLDLRSDSTLEINGDVIMLNL